MDDEKMGGSIFRYFSFFPQALTVTGTHPEVE